MRTTPANNMDVKRLNRSNTLRCLLRCDKISQPELAQKLKLSWPTVLQNVKELTALGLVQEVGAYESTGGRKAKAYAPVRDAKLAVGLDITQNHVGLVLVDLSGEILRYTRKKRVFSLQEDYLASLGNLLTDFLEGGEGEKLLEFLCPVFWMRQENGCFIPMHWTSMMWKQSGSARTFPTPVFF